MRRLFLAGLVLLGVSNAGAASELGDEYTAYQEAAAAGDLHGALPHAQRAFELGLEQFGPDSRNTGFLAFNYGMALNESLNFDEAAPVLDLSVSALSGSNASDAIETYDAMLERAKSRLGMGDADAAQTVLDDLFAYSIDNFGAMSVQAAMANLYGAMVPLFGDLEEGSGRFISSGRYVFELTRQEAAFRERPGRSRHAMGETEELDQMSAVIDAGIARAEMAWSVFSGFPDRETDRAQTELVLSGLELLRGETERADEQFRDCLNTLIEFGFADHFLTHIAVDWITGINRYEWSPEQLADNFNLVATFAALRREGHIHPVIRIPPTYPIAGFDQNVEATVCLRFNVLPTGRVEGAEVYTTDHPRYFNRSALEAVEQFIYLPQMRDGHAVTREAVNFCFEFTLAQ